MHLFGQPENRDLESSFARFEAEFLQDFIALFCVDDGLCILGIHFSQPVIQVEVRILQNEWSPVGDIVVAHFPFSFRTFHDGEYEMYVRMYQFIEFHTRRTYSAGIRLIPVGATDVAGISDSQRHLTDSFGATDQLGMRYAPFTHFLNESLLDFFLSDYVSEKHINK